MPKGWKRRSRQRPTRASDWTKVDRPVTWADPEMVREREARKAAQELRDFHDMQREMGFRRAAREEAA